MVSDAERKAKARVRDGQRQPCYEETIRGKEWTEAQAGIKSVNGHILLRFRFDCGPANDTTSDNVQIAGIDLRLRNSLLTLPSSTSISSHPLPL